MYQFNSPDQKNRARPQKSSALLLKGGVLRSGNNIQDGLGELRKRLYFYRKGLWGFNETESHDVKGVRLSRNQI